MAGGVTPLFFNSVATNIGSYYSRIIALCEDWDVGESSHPRVAIQTTHGKNIP